MSVSTEMYKDLESQFGKEFADQITQQAEIHGKQLEAQGTAFKSTPPQKLSEAEVLIFSGLKALTEAVTKQFAALEDERKTAKDMTNQVNLALPTITEIRDLTKRMAEWLGNIVNKSNAASKAPSTQVFNNDPQMNFLHQQNEKGDKPEPIFNQMKNMGFGGQIVMPDFMQQSGTPTPPAPADTNGANEQSGSTAT